MKPLHRILFWPAVLAVATIAGLVLALFSDDAGDLIATACLAAVALVGIRPLLSWRRR